MSPVFIASSNKYYSPSLDSSSMPAIALNNAQIRTLINIYPPTSTLIPPVLPQNFAMHVPNDSRKHNSSAIAAQTLYQLYFPHLLSIQNQQQTSEFMDRGIKRTNIMDGKLIVYILFSFLFVSFEESLPLEKRKSNTVHKRFDFAKLADEAVKDKEEISNSSTSLDVSSNKIDLSISSTTSSQPAPAAITSGVSLLTSHTTL